MSQRKPYAGCGRRLPLALTMTTDFPATVPELLAWSWPEIAPHFARLASQPLTAAGVEAWLSEWSRLAEYVHDLQIRLYVATTVNTADAEAQARYQRYLDETFPAARAADQHLKEKLLASGLEPGGMAVPLRNLRAEADLFRADNLPLLAEVEKLNTRYDQVIGAQTVAWEGEEITLTQLLPVLQSPDRDRREAAWRASAERQLADRAAIDAQWREYLALRDQIAANADLGGDYRAYRWREMLRFDYSPGDCARFHDAIAEVVVPAAQRIYERRRQRLGLSALRPWDLDVDPLSRSPLRPFHEVADLIARGASMLHAVDPELGAHFDVMRAEGLLDLDNRKHKAPGGYCDAFFVPRRPFIFMNAAGLHDDVTTLLHEAGHSFHVFETAHLPYYHQLNVGNEFGEVASMSMELLAAPYLEAERGGFYSTADAARARVEHLEGMLLFWPYMAIVDAFQHWVYAHPADAADPANCDAHWAALWQRFRPGVDWSGLEDVRDTGWHRKLHIHQLPFYYVEYGLAQLGAVQVWANALQDQTAAVHAYRAALALGATATLPDLFQAAGAHFAFDAATLRRAIDLMESTIARLDPR
jgi:oligoendopeptidase F